MSNAALEQMLDDLPVGTDVESSRGYDEPDMPSDVAEVVGRLTPSPASDPDWGKSPRQIEREAEAQREEAGGEAKGCGLLELFGTEGLSDAQLGDMHAEEAYRQELAEEAAAKAEAEARAAQEPAVDEYAAELVQEAAQHSDYAADAVQKAEAATRDELGRIDQISVQLQQQFAAVEQAFAAAQQAGDQEGMLRAQQYAAQLQQQHAQVDQYRQQREQEAAVLGYVHQSEASFRQHQPGYDGAYHFMIEQLDALQRQKYPNAAPEQHAQIKRVVQMQFAERCRRSGIDMAEAIYLKACELGYQAPQPVRKAAPPAQVQPQHPVQQSVQPRAMPSLAQIAEMDAGQFEQFWSQFERAGTVMPREW